MSERAQQSAMPMTTSHAACVAAPACVPCALRPRRAGLLRRVERTRAMDGFSLVELVVTMAIAAILLGVAMPSFRNFMQNSRLATEANTLVYSLNLARSEAIKRDTQVEVCASSDGATCNGGAWNVGWIVCFPVVVNACAAAGGTPLTVLQASPALGPVGDRNNADELNTNALDVIYQSNGQTNNGAAGTSYSFAFCDNRGAGFGQNVGINFIGRIESAPTQGKTVSGAALAGC